ncbi:MAG: hypothetical protein AAF485_22790 [Chloroflexota bacterium]
MLNKRHLSFFVLALPNAARMLLLVLTTVTSLMISLLVLSWILDLLNF